MKKFDENKVRPWLKGCLQPTSTHSEWRQESPQGEGICNYN
jgi:hypothetical protein